MTINEHHPQLLTLSNYPGERPGLNNEWRTAVFSEDKIYRYSLRIVWDELIPLCQFIGLNPSTADARQDDPTMRRCKDFAKRWGHGGLIMCNLFAFRATEPADMKAHAQPIGERAKYFCTRGGFTFEERNDFFIWLSSLTVSRTVAAWGINGDHLGRDAAVAAMFAGKLECLGRNDGGSPKHPLYLAANTPLASFR